MPRDSQLHVGLETIAGPPVVIVLTFRDRGARRGATLTLRPRSAAALWALLGAQVNGEEIADSEVTITADLEITDHAAPSIS